MKTCLDDVDLSMDCPCGQPSSLLNCCGAIILKEATAATAEALMRSRYTAYCLSAADYLLATWHPSTRPQSLDFDPAHRWLGLRIIACEKGLAVDASGQVEFLARYKINGRAYRLQEISRFVRLIDDWVYLDGEVRANPT